MSMHTMQTVSSNILHVPKVYMLKVLSKVYINTHKCYMTSTFSVKKRKKSTDEDDFEQQSLSLTRQSPKREKESLL